MKNNKVINVLSPNIHVVFTGSYNKCIKIKNILGFGYIIL